QLTHPAGTDGELQGVFAHFAEEQNEARIGTLEQLASALRRDLDARHAAFEREGDTARDLRVLRCPQWNLQSEAKIEAKTTLDGFNCSGSEISLFGMTRYGGPVSAQRGEDLYFPTFRLQNGWTVDSIFFRAVVSREGEADAKLVESAAGGNTPSIRVRWWATPGDSVHYVLLVTIVGPRGTPYE
ncbi:MAG TPA: hypothetical protein VIL97_10890, partial [Thermoanaerobaculia bacterium]